MTVLDTILDFAGVILVLAGALFTLVAALGLVRLPDLFSRTHAAAKPQLLGLMLILGGSNLVLRTWAWFAISLAVLAIQVIAAPVASHLLGRAAYRSGLAETSSLVVDQLGEKGSEK